MEKSTTYINVAIALLLTYIMADFVWSTYMIRGILLPLLTLIGILVMFYKHSSHIAYVLMLSICFASMISNAYFFPDNWYELLTYRDDSLFSPFRICWSCVIIRSFKSFLVGTVLIALLHNRAIATKYQWSIQSFFLAIVNGFVLFLLMRWYVM